MKISIYKMFGLRSCFKRGLRYLDRCLENMLWHLGEILKLYFVGIGCLLDEFPLKFSRVLRKRVFFMYLHTFFRYLYHVEQYSSCTLLHFHCVVSPFLTLYHRICCKVAERPFLPLSKSYDYEICFYSHKVIF